MTPPVDWVGPTPWEEVADSFQETCPDGKFTMELAGADIEVAKLVVNQGIDSRLEAIAQPSSFRWLNKGRTRLACSITLKGFLVFIRRLYELETDEARDLRSAMLGAISIEEV